MNDTLRPAVFAMAVFIALVHMLPLIITQPTGIKLIDDMVLFVMSAKSISASGAILIALTVVLSTYLQNLVL